VTLVPIGRIAGDDITISGFVSEFEEVVEGSGEDSCYFFRIETRDHALFYAGGVIGGSGVRMEESDAGTDSECGFCEAEGQLAEVLYAEWSGDLGVVSWEADFF